MATMMQFLKYLWAHHVKFRVQGKVPPFLTDYVNPISSQALSKTVLVQAAEQTWMVVIPTSARIDIHALQTFLRAEHVRRATREEISSLVPNCREEEIPPFGNLYGLPVIMDRKLAGEDEIAFNACSLDEYIVMKFDDYERLTRPIIANIAESPRVVELT